MKSLPEWDSHIHLINGSEPICSKNVVLIQRDVYDTKEIYNDINKFIKFKYNPEKHIVMANGANQFDLQKCLSLEYCKGIGEINIYKNYFDDSSFTIREFWDDSLLSVLQNEFRPIYLHWDLVKDKHFNDFIRFLNDNPEKKIVLCHCGINNNSYNQDFAANAIIDLQNTYSNLWVDVSWYACEYYINHPEMLYLLDPKRILLGSDMTTKEDVNKCIDYLSIFNDKIDNTNNIKKLFII